MSQSNLDLNKQVSGKSTKVPVIQTSGISTVKPAQNYDLTHRRKVVESVREGKACKLTVYVTDNSERQIKRLAKLVAAKGLRNINIGLQYATGDKSTYRMHFTAAELSELSEITSDQFIGIVLGKINSMKSATYVINKLSQPVIFSKGEKDYPTSLVVVELI